MRSKIRRSRADGLQNRQHVHALFQMRMHRHGHANRAQHHGHQADQAQDRGRIVQPTAQRRIALAKVHHLRIGQRLLHAACGPRRSLHRGHPCGGSFIQQSMARRRLPGASSPVRASAACEIITRGPRPAPP